jgi:malonate-semialdehyde dehydrogenase (acetylating)/methylmalonate-semialdehyde dehydrogenase
MSGVEEVFNFINGTMAKTGWETAGENILDPANTGNASLIFPFPILLRKMRNSRYRRLKRVLKWRKHACGRENSVSSNLLHFLVSEQDALARIITRECGKTYNESLGELKRAFENI